MLKKNRLSKCTINGDKQLQKNELDHIEQCTSSEEVV